ncbi:MAG: ATP-dependent helicase HrpB [Planctomycetes bacterium]|nr:ATP-dependent helicase HrpB [Planctomycetota bacterium]
MEPLPIDEHLPRIVAAARAGRDLVLQAPPGSGKTTRVPAALVDACLAGGGRVLVLEPRRIAARLAARRVAEERGGRLGGEVGYCVRFEDVSSKETRLLFLTEGLLTRLLLEDAELLGVSAVVFDEFHERSLHADLGLGMVREIKEALRPDLRLVVMSATLDCAQVASVLGAEALHVPGRPHPVAIEHAERREEGDSAQRAARALRRAIDQAGGTLPCGALVFLPGTGEILRAAGDLEPLGRALGFDVLPLFGELPLERQDLALCRGPRPRVVLATNVAETSVTADGIGLVIDCGLARVPRHDARSGVDRLVLERITRASAEQRAGRAGRQGPGRCLRLYTKGEEREMLDALEPEVLRLDLCEALLALRAFGCRDALAFRWLTPPPRAAVERAETLLRLLGALAPGGSSLTALGRRLARLPVHPRLGRMLLEAETRGCVRDGALLAALSSSRLRSSRPAPASGRSDLLELRDLFLELRAARFDRSMAESFGLDARAALAVDREARQLERLAGGRQRAAPAEDDLLCCVLAGHPDRVARRRGPGSAEAVMVGGHAIEIVAQSSVRDAEFLVVLDAVEAGAGRQARCRVASAIEERWLAELFPEALRTEEITVWNEERGQAERWRRELYLDLVLHEARAARPDPEEAALLLAQAATHPRFLAALRAGGLERLLLRVECLRSALPELGLPEVSDERLAEAVASLCRNRTSVAEIKDAPIEQALLAVLGPGAARLDALVPERLRLPSGRAARVTYRAGQPPLVSARLQEFFGACASPRIAAGRVAVALDLLAPNGRSVQVTSDLESFWRTLYPKERRELARRYPRHPWPEDPLSAAPTARPLPRRGG